MTSGSADLPARGGGPKAVKYVISRGNSCDGFKTVKLSDVRVTGFHRSGQGNGPDEKTGKSGGGKGGGFGGLPRETISLDFAPIELSCKPRRSDGGFDNALKSGHDVAAAKPICEEAPAAPGRTSHGPPRGEG